MRIIMKKCIYKGALKSVYVDKDKAEKVFALSYNKSDVLYEALNTARVEDTGLDIPRLLNVSVVDGKWTITSEYAKGETLKELLAKHPENSDAYIEAMVDYQIAINKHSNPLLVDMKSKLERQINELNIPADTKYELESRLSELPYHKKLCHGDYCPENIIVQTDDKNQIVAITAVDWVHATKGNASADAANTYLSLKLSDEALADKYITMFCEKTSTDKRYVDKWIPIVAAARLTKKKPEEKEMLEAMIDICDFQ
jgi:tRNA A-37 threonylcarbamoyl transferase component Bud32